MLQTLYFLKSLILFKCVWMKKTDDLTLMAYSLKPFQSNSRGSVTTPVTAAAAATSGLARSVLAPGP